MAVPSNIRGRGTSIGGNGSPTESQAYWTPDPRRLSKGPLSAEQDAAILASLHPTKPAHPTLDLEMSEELLPGGSGVEANEWRAVVEATLVPTLTVGTSNTQPQPIRTDRVADEPEAAAFDDDPEDTSLPEDGYDAPVELTPTSIEVGDLVLVDDSDAYCLDTRDDLGEVQSMIVPTDTRMPTRRR